MISWYGMNDTIRFRTKPAYALETLAADRCNIHIKAKFHYNYRKRSRLSVALIYSEQPTILAIIKIEWSERHDKQRRSHRMNRR